MLRVGMFGTFDIGNFGDILFPLVAEKKLAELTDIKLTRFSYNKMEQASWCYDVTSISDLPKLLQELDLVIIGGGHLIHFNAQMASNYRPSDKGLPHPLGFWWLPAIAASTARLPVVLHGVSSDPHFPAWGGPLLETFMGSLDYASVRDTGTAERLGRYNGSGKEIAIVPDSIFSISDVIKRGQYSSDFADFRRSVGLADKYMIIQPSDSLWRRRDQILGYAAQAKDLGWSVLELPIGFGIGNSPGFYGHDESIIRARDWPEPLLLAEIIANAEAAIGISLHLSVVSSAYGIPVIRPGYSPNSKFILLDGFPNISFLEDNPPLKGLSDAIPDLSLVTELKRQLDIHWKRIISTADTTWATTPLKAMAAWNQMTATPDAFRGLQSRADRRTEIIQNVVRRRQFFMHKVRKRLFS